MRSIICYKRAVFALFFAFFSVETSQAETGRFYLGLNGGYKTGSFGTQVRSDLFYGLSEFGYIAARYEAGIAVPYLFLNNNAAHSNSLSAVNGIGDVILRGGAVLLAEGESGFSFDGALAVKLAAADRFKGLGSGGTDIGAFCSANQRVMGTKITFILGYIKAGQVSNAAFNDIYSYGAGISRIFGFTNAYTSFEGRTAMIAGAQNPAEIHIGAFHVLNRRVSIKGSLFIGLSDGGPGFGSEAGMAHWF